MIFSDVKVGTMFHINGNTYVKQSSRTGKMLSNGRPFYFSARENVHIFAW